MDISLGGVTVTYVTGEVGTPSPNDNVVVASGRSHSHTKDMLIRTCRPLLRITEVSRGGMTGVTDSAHHTYCTVPYHYLQPVYRGLYSGASRLPVGYQTCDR
jgi:hypothetical protein